MFSVLLLAGLLSTPAAFARAQDAGGDAEAEAPTVDVVEIAGIIDRPLHRYALERLDAAEQAGARLLVFQIDSLGGMKISEAGELPEIVRRIRDSSIPVAVHVGPRDARAGGAAMLMSAAAHVSSIGLSATLGPVVPIDHAHPAASIGDEFTILSAERGRVVTVADTTSTIFGRSDAVAAGWADVGAPSVAAMLEQIDGRTVRTAAGEVTLDLPKDGIDIRFYQPGPIRRLLHTFANPALLYLMLMGGAVLIMFELFQPGFGVAGVTGGILLVAAGYGLTVLPGQALGLGLLIAGLLALTVDVALDGLAVPTALGAVGVTVGSFLLFPAGAEPVHLSPWLIGFTVASALIVFVPVMTVVTRARVPVAREVKTRLIGEAGQVRSMLNPEGFIFVDGEIWRARTLDGSRMRVGESVLVDSIDGTVLMVRTTEGSDQATTPDPVPSPEEG